MIFLKEIIPKLNELFFLWMPQKEEKIGRKGTQAAM